MTRLLNANISDIFLVKDPRTSKNFSFFRFKKNIYNIKFRQLPEKRELADKLIKKVIQEMNVGSVYKILSGISALLYYPRDFI